jgi:hypothetical protein
MQILISREVKKMEKVFNIPLAIDNHSKVSFYRYRMALVRDVFAEMGRDEASELELQLSEMAGVYPDNHTAFSIVDRWGLLKPIYIQFSDTKARFGLTIEQVNW